VSRVQRTQAGAGVGGPHARKAAWTVLDGATARYSAVREGERHLRFLTGGPEPDPALAEFRDVAHPKLWGSLDAWRSRRSTGHKPGPSGDRGMDYMAWLAALPEGLVWLPDAAEERAAFDSWRVKTQTKASALGAYVPQV
jgi:hypothetical protein